MITLVRYDTNIQECRPMLDEYYLHHDTPDNNASDRALKLSLCDGHNGVIWFLVDDQKIIATFGALAVQVTPGIKAIKMPHRLHVRKSHTANHNEFIDKWFEPALYPWIASTGITNIMMTMNEGNERALFLSGFRHDRRRRFAAVHLDELGQRFLLSTWRVMPYLILEMNTWQYLYWTSLSNIPWKSSWRDTRPMPDDVYKRLDSRLSRHPSGGWVL